MPSKVINALEKTIDSRYHLRRVNRDWCLDNNVRIRAPNRDTIGFSLDDASNPPLAFLGNSPPEHVAKMCDAMIATIHKQQTYVFVIEQKTAHKDDYKKQIANGQMFCDWLIQICRFHKIIPDDAIKYIGLLVWEPRPTPPKGTTSHKRPKQALSHPLFHRVFDEKNKELVLLQSLISAASTATAARTR